MLIGNHLSVHKLINIMLKLKYLPFKSSVNKKFKLETAISAASASSKGCKFAGNKKVCRPCRVSQFCLVT